MKKIVILGNINKSSEKVDPERHSMSTGFQLKDEVLDTSEVFYS